MFNALIQNLHRIDEMTLVYLKPSKLPSLILVIEESLWQSHLFVIKSTV